MSRNPQRSRFAMTGAVPVATLLLAVCLGTIAGPTAQAADPTAPAAPKAAAASRYRSAEPVRAIADFTLTGQDGQPVAFHDLRDQTVLVFFGFTHCQSVCPPTMQKLLQVVRGFEPPSTAPTVVMISVDGERDTPQAMKQFLSTYDPRFLGLTGPPAEVRRIAEQFSAVFFKGMPNDTAGGYDVEHTSQVYLVDAEGKLRGAFYAAATDEMIAKTREVARAAK
jgi:protein SCO1/2